MAHVNEIFAFNCDLGKTVVWTTSGVDLEDLRLLVVEVLDRGRVHIHLKGNLERDVSWVINRGWEAFNFWGSQEFSRYHKGVVEFTSNIIGISEVRSNSDYSSSSRDRSFSWVDIEQIRRSEIVEDIVIISILLVVESYFNNGLSENIWRWRVTDNLGRVYDGGWNLGKVLKHTERIISVINFIRVVFEGEKVSTFN